MSKPGSRAQILVVANVPQDIRAAMAAHFDLVDHVMEGAAPQTVESLPDGFAAVLTRALFGVPRAVMDAMPDLQLIVSLGAGVDKLDFPEAERRGITIAYNPDDLTEDVADFAIGLLYAGRRRLIELDRLVRSGEWGARVTPVARRACNSRLGVVGLGKIGRRIADKGAALGMEVHYHSRRQRTDAGLTFHADVADLAAWCDVLVLACEASPQTHHMVNGAVLQALGSDGLLINIARGSVVDEEAMIIALQTGVIGGAALDVFAAEPAVDSRFASLDNVVLSPHAASLTRETRAAIIARLVHATKTHFAV
jgi:hydroxypyruvate reductase